MNGCHNRPPLGRGRFVVDGVIAQPSGPHGRHVLVGRFVSVPHAHSTDCRYTHSAGGRSDPGCAGCRWRAPDASPAPAV